MARKMKDSGIEWIGEIPEGWKITKIKHIVSSVTDIDHFMPDSAEFGIPYLMIGDLKDLSSSIDWDSSKKISIEDYKKLSIKSRPQIGDIIFARYASIGTTCYIDTDRDFLVSYACLTIHPSDLIIGKFLSYYLKSSSFAEDVLRRTNSNTQGNVGKDSLVNATIVLPSIIEQTQITNFLDAKCSDINAMLSETRSSIEEYKKLKQAVITQAVTKGVHGEREMKDCGVDWIGEIPVDWTIQRFARVAEVKSNLVSPDNYLEYPQISPENIEKDSGKLLLPCKTVGEVGIISGNHLFYKGQILYSKIRPKLNKVCIAPFDGLCSADMYPIETNNDTRYIMYCILSNGFLQQVSMITENRVKMPKINQVELSKILVAMPCFLAEQKEIANYLDAKCAEIDKLIVKKEQLVKELESYKKSLIYEVVTGKREV